MRRFLVRRDYPHTKGEAGPAGERPADYPRREGVGIIERVACHWGDGQRVLIFGREAAALVRALEAQGCRAVAVVIEGRRPEIDLDPGHETISEPGDPLEGAGGGRFDAIILADLLGRIDNPRAFLGVLKEQIRPEGSLVVTLGGIAPIGGRLAIMDGGPLGPDSGVLFTEEGLVGLLEESGYLIGQIERNAPSTEADVHDCLIVAYPLPVPGLDHLQRRLRDLAQQGQDAAREAEQWRRQVAQAEQRLEILAGNERRMAERISELRARLLDAHAQMIRRDDEIWKTFGDAIYLRNALLIERDALRVEHDALLGRLDAAEARLELFRKSPFGLAYRVLRKLAQVMRASK